MFIFHKISWIVAGVAILTRSAVSTTCVNDYCYEDENDLSYVSFLQKRMMTETAVAKAPIKLNQDTCTEAVVVEPRESPAIVRVAESALQQSEINLITLAHGRLNAEYVRTLVAGSQILMHARKQHRLRYLDLRVEDLGGDEASMTQRMVNRSSSTPSRDQDSLQAAANSTSNGDDVDGLRFGFITSRRALTLVQADQTYHDQYSRILKSKEFWNMLSCDRVVLMQSDTLFCPGSKFRLSDFNGYSYIGGHTPGIDGVGRIHMNGGFSLHSRPAALACLDVQDPLLQQIHQEDIFYSKCPLLRQPPVSVVDSFAIDNALKFVDEIPLGVHKPWSQAGQYSEHTMDLCAGSRKLSDEQPI